MNRILRRTLPLAIATALVVAAPASAAPSIGLEVESATADAIAYKVASPQPGEYIARYSTSLKGSGPRAVFRFSDHDAQGRHIWNGRFKAGNRGLKLCLGQSSDGKLIEPPSWEQVCSPVLNPRKTSKPLAEGLKVTVRRRKVSFVSLDPALPGNFARVKITINKSAKAKGRRTRKASRGVKIKPGKTTYKPALRPGETLRSVVVKIEDDYHRFKGTVKR